MSLMTVVYIIEVAFGVGMLIFVHELGHFLLARREGVRVETFSLGFGPRLFGLRRGATDYRVSLVPLGGYVKMAGESLSMEGTGAPDEFTSKSVRARAFIASGGVLMNLISGMIIFCLAFAFGVKFVLPEVGTVIPGSKAHRAGLQAGDRIVSVNGRSVNHYRQLDLAIAYSDEGEEIEIVVERQGEEGIRTVRIIVHPEKDVAAGLPLLGGFYPRRGGTVAAVGGDSPAARAVLPDGSPFPIRKGDLITSVAGVPIDPADGVAILREIFDRPGEEVPIRLRRGAEIRTVLEREGEIIRPRLEVHGGEEIEVTIEPKVNLHYGIGAHPRDYPEVKGEVLAGAPAHGVLQEGDKILKVQGVDARVRSLRAATRFSRGRPMAITVQRGEEELDLSLTPRFYGGGGQYMVGVPDFTAPVVGTVDPGSPAERAGLQPGDRLRKIDDVEPRKVERRIDGVVRRVAIWQLFELHLSVDEERTLEVLRGDKVLKLKVKPEAVEGHASGSSDIGIPPAFFSFRSSSILEATRLGVRGTVDWVQNVFLTIRNLANRRVDPKHLGGPIMIAQSSYHFATQGFGTILYFLGIISVNLAILNVLPIPILDGGLLFFLLIEKIKGSPVSEKYMIAANYFGLLLLLSLMLYVTYNDVMRSFLR